MPDSNINFPSGLSITSPVFRDLLNKLAGMSGSQDIEVTSPLVLDTVGDGLLLSILSEDSEIIIIKTESASATALTDSRGYPVQWIYTAKEQLKLTRGYNDTGGSTIVSRWVESGQGWQGKAFNLIESENTGEEVQGNGIDFDRASFPLNFKMQPVPDGTVLMAKMVSVIEPASDSELGNDGIGTEAWFSYENAIDGPSDHTFIVDVYKTGGVAGNATTRCSWTYEVKDLNGNVLNPELGTGMTPNVQRPTVGAMLQGDGLVGIGYYTVAGVFDLVSAGEVPDPAAC